ncbi:MAG TPA: WS/DGAT domain-containing protein, partial [Solirubrobacteraceae bacterium]
ALALAGAAAADARALGKLLLTPADSGGAFKGELGTARTVAWGKPLSLESVKAIAHAQHATVNDVMLAAVSGALRGYLIEHGREPQELRTTVPYNLRPANAAGGEGEAELGNRFGLVFLTLPVDRASRRERLGELKLRMDAIKHSPEGPVSYALLEVIGLTPPDVESRLVDVFTAKATAVMTNVPGPRETVYLAGSPLRRVLVWAPTAGSVGMSVSIFSYDGRITVGLLVHTALVPDPQSILERLRREIAALARLAPSANGRSA